MHDKVLNAFLERQYDLGRELAESSDLLELFPLGDPPIHHYVARFRCKGLTRARDGEIVESELFEVGIRFPLDYLRRADPGEVLTWLGPQEIFHPNIRAPFICVGRLAPGTGLVDLLFQCYEIISYWRVTMREDDALNVDACAWARRNQHRFPIDRRPLKNRGLSPDGRPGDQER
jgi:hypothetical protein